jgi:hypothetical protein
LTRLRQEPQLRRALSEQAVVAGNRDFDPVRIRQNFLEHLRAVARSKVPGLTG